MEVREALMLSGEVEVTVRDARGRIVRQVTIRNVLTTRTKQAVAQWLAGVSYNSAASTWPAPDRIALGSGTGTPAETDTALFAEVAATRKACAYRDVTMNSYAQFTTQYQSTDPAGTFTEAGLFDTAGNLMAHVLLGNVSKSGTETMTVQWKIRVA